MKKGRYVQGDWQPRPLSSPWGLEGSSALAGVKVWVAPLAPEAEALGLDRARLKTEAELRLALAGIPLQEPLAPGDVPQPHCLGVIVNLRGNGGCAVPWVFSLEVFFIQSEAGRDRAMSTSLEMPWCKEAVGEVGGACSKPEWDHLYHNLGCLVDECARELSWLKANVKTSCRIN